MSDEKKLRNYIRKIIVESIVPDEHIMLSGNAVPFGCDECVADIQMRIGDTSRQRDMCPRGTADRSSLNGVLAMLRRQLRSANRINMHL